MGDQDLNGTLDGIIREILDVGMSISDGACTVEGVRMEDNQSNTGIIVAVLLVLVAICLCIVGFFTWRKMNQNEAMKMRKKGRNSHICKGKLLALFFWFLLIMMMMMMI